MYCAGSPEAVAGVVDAEHDTGYGVQAEYWYNNVTGEASWLDPRYGSMAV